MGLFLGMGTYQGFEGHFSDLRGLSFYISFNKSEDPACVGCNPIHMSIPAQVSGDIHPQVPGTADNLQDLSK